MADKIQVAVRVRPVLFQKKDVEIHWGCEQGNTVVQLEPGTGRRIGHPHPFNHVFGTEASNHQVFEAIVQPLIDSAIDGFNATVLAYGQTASGKTYTMMGSQKEPGVVQLAVDRIFHLIEQNPERAFLLRCSYIEIYNETISDLLSPSHQKLKVQELAEGHVVVHNLSETNVNTPDAVVKLMQRGNKQRKVGGTSMNERSSRSHTIFRIIVESVPRAEADRSDAAVIVSHINLVDLAGSEKASQTQATGDRFREGCAINTSLSALSLVIKQLSEGEGFVNFRDSKLTHILRASLGGNARTAIICNVTPTVLDETSSTLKFASSAKTVSNQPHVNEILSDQALLRKYHNYIKDLERKLKENEHEKKPGALQEMERLLEEKDMMINELKEQLVVSSCSTASRLDDSLTAAQRSLRRMTWGGNRLKQHLRGTPFDGTPLFARNRLANFSTSEIALDDVMSNAGDTPDSADSEMFVPAEHVFARPAAASSLPPAKKVDAATMTEGPSPVESPMFRRPATPSTPAAVLRERVSSLRRTLSEKEREADDLREELEDLTNFTRLEQQIGVHPQVIAKHSSSQESAEQLQKALQTANDMEVLYLDCQRKLSDLQTESRAKEVEYEEELQRLKTNFQEQLETEVSEKKRLAKELFELKTKHERLELDHAEADTHVQVLNERHAKREAELRQTLQDAWSQLERLGQDPKAIQDASAAKEQLADMEKRLEESEKQNQEAQKRIDALTEELRVAQEAATKAEPQRHQQQQQHLMDNSLTGSCLADELRDVMGAGWTPSANVRSARKRPSSILSVALAKMDQSTTMLDCSEMEIEAKKTRLSMTPNPAGLDSVDGPEIAYIREHLVELQTVLVRYESDFEALSQEKETLTGQLAAAQAELTTLRSSLEKAKSRSRLEGSFRSAEGVDLSADEPSNMDNMEMDMTEEDSVPLMSSSSLRTPDEESESEQKLKQQLEHVTNQLRRMQDDMDDKIGQLDEARRALDAARTELDTLREEHAVDEQLTTNANEQIETLTGQVSSLTEELTAARQEVQQLSEANEDIRKRLEEAEQRNEGESLKEQIESLQTELDIARQSFSLDREKLSSQLEGLEADLETKNRQIVTIQEAAEESVRQSRQELETERQQWTVEHNRALEECRELKELSQRLEAELSEAKTKMEELQDDSAKSSNVTDFQATLEEMQVALQDMRLTSEHLQAQVAELEAELTSKTAQVDELGRQLGSKTEDVQSLQAALEEAQTRARRAAEAEEEVQRLRSALEETQSQTGRLEEMDGLALQLQQKDEDIRRLQSALEEAQAQSDRTGNVEGLSGQLMQKEEDVQRLQSALEEASRTQAALTKQMEELAQQLRDKEETIQQLQTHLEESQTQTDRTGEIEELSGQLQGLKSAMEEATRSQAEVAGQMEDLAQQLREKEEIIQRLQSNLEESKTQADRAGEVEELSERLRQKEEDLQKLQSALEEASRSQAALTGQMEEFVQQLRAKEEAIQELQTVLEGAQAQAGKLVEMDELVRQLSHKEETIQQLQTYQQEAEDLRSQVEQTQDLLQQLESKEDEIQRLQVSLEEAQSKAERLCEMDELARQLEVKDLTIQQLQSVQQEAEELSEKLKQKETELERLQSLQDEAEDRIRQLQSSLEEAQSQAERLGEIDELTRQLEQKEETIQRLQSTAEEAAHLRQQLERKEEDIQKLLQEAANLNQQLEVKEDRVLNLQSALEDVQSKAEQLVSRCDLDDAIQRLREMERRVDLAQQAAEEAEKRAQSGRAGLEAEFNDALARVKELEQCLEDNNCRLNAAKARTHILEQEAAASVAQLTEMADKNANLGRQVETLHSDLMARQEELDNMRSLASKVSALEAKLERGEAELSALSGALQEKTHQVARLEEELALRAGHQEGDREQLRRLQERLSEREVELKSVRQSLEEMQTVNDRLVGQLGDQDSACNELKAKLDNGIQRFMMLQGQLDSVQAEKKAAAERIQSLEAELDARQAELEDLRQSAREKDMAVRGYEETRTALDALRSEREEILADYQRMKATLEQSESQLECLRKQRDELAGQEKLLSGQVGELRGRIALLESGSRHQVQRQLEEANEALRRELRDAKSGAEVLRLNFEKDEDSRKKKIDRLEKELEALRKEYSKLKEQIRLTRHHDDGGTVQLPKLRASVATESVVVQTDPIGDKGFGFRWQMEQYVADNERLRKKASEVGERMEFYKEKLIKYRTLYFEATGQDHPVNKRPLSSSSSQPGDQLPLRENSSSEGMMSAESEKNPLRSKASAPLPPPNNPSAAASLASGGGVSKVSSASGAAAASTVPTASATVNRWGTSTVPIKREGLTKEEMEKINNCNPS